MSVRLVALILESSSESDSDSDTTCSFSSDEQRELHHSVNNFIEVVRCYSAPDFKKHFRLEKSTAQLLIDQYAVSEIYTEKFNSTQGAERIASDVEIYMFLWYVGNTEPYRTVANLFGVTKSTAWNVVKRVTKWIISISHNFVKWPENLALTSAGFETKRGMRGVIGAIDGTDIKIQAPSENAEDYCNRKKFYSIKLQAVVGPNKEFLDIYCGEAGSLHDSRVLRRSQLFHQLQESGRLVDDYYIIGDSAYPCNNWLITPFRDNGHLNRQQKKFNNIHSSTRIVVENAFGMLKKRFRRIQFFTEHRHLEQIINITAACCVLHNICIQQSDEMEFELNEVPGPALELTDGVDVENFNKRNQIVSDLIRRNLM